MNLVMQDKRHFGLTTDDALRLLVLHLLTALLILSPFLPGPSAFSQATNSLFSVFQFLSLPGLLLVPVGLLWLWHQRRQPKATRLGFYPLLLCTLPVMLFVHSFGSAQVLRSWSRSRAITRSAPLLAALATYQAKHQRYPVHLTDLRPRYLPQLPSPGVMGIAGYTYETHPDCFQLTFAQNVLLGFNFEVVAYDPRDHHQAQGELSTLSAAGAPHWQFYIYD
ncbi:hypothetical protein ACW9KT_21810 [Hymenobacter sp. HD11105]